MPIRVGINPIFDSTSLVFLVGLALCALLLLQPVFSGATPQRRRWLVWLRLGVIGLLVLAMLRPSLIRSEKQEVSSTVAVLLDTSRSMQIEDVGNRSRYSVLRSSAERCLELSQRANKSLRFQFFTFDALPTAIPPVDGALPLDDAPAGKETDIARALDQVLQQTQAQRLGAVILISDGAVRAYHPVVDLRRVATDMARQERRFTP